MSSTTDTIHVTGDSTVEASRRGRQTRSRNGCLRCRKTRVKCDEVHPSCGRCLDRNQPCEWPGPSDGPAAAPSARKQRNPRAVSSCDSCRTKKLKCEGAAGTTCQPCALRNISCEWSQASGRQRRTSSCSRSASPVARSLAAYDEFPTYAEAFAPATSTDDFVFPPPLPRSAHPPASGSVAGQNESSSRSLDFLTPPSVQQPGRLSLSQAQRLAPTASRLQQAQPIPPRPPVNHTPSEARPTIPTPGAPLAQAQAYAPPAAPSVSMRDPRIRDLIRLYFATVHNFGFLSYIHEGDFWDRYEHARIPDTLCQLMVASALRFGSASPSAEDVAQADAWALEAGNKMLGSVFNEFGAIDLMALVLCHHYDFQAGRYSRGWMMAGMAVRMMTFLRLHILDETPHPSPRPFLSLESLRRLAWAVWYLDATLDGGNFGFSTIGDGAITIQLPCDERPFLLHQTVPTEPLMPRDDTPPVPLGLAAHLIRSMHARQILADAHSRIQRKLIPRDSIYDLVRHTSNEARAILDTLPREMVYGRGQYHAYRDQRAMLVHLHVMRNTCERHLVLLRLLAIGGEAGSTGQSGEGDGGEEISRRDRGVAAEIFEARKQLIDGARTLSRIFTDALEYRVVMDPQMAMHAYNGIEVLLFQPMRQTMERAEATIKRADVTTFLKPLLEVVRNLAGVSELVALIRPEAVNRMIRLGYIDDLTNDDVMAVLRKVHSLANVDTEFDFNESFWRYELSLTRATTTATANQHPAPSGSATDGHTQPTIVAESPNDRLLETHSDVSPNHPGEMEVSAGSRLAVGHLISPQQVGPSRSGLGLAVSQRPDDRPKDPDVNRGQGHSHHPPRTVDHVQPFATAPTSSTIHEDPLTRLHSFLATNSRRNSFSGPPGINGTSNTDEAPTGGDQALEPLGAGSITGQNATIGEGPFDFDFAFGGIGGFGMGLGMGSGGEYDLGPGDDLLTLLTNGVRAGTGSGGGSGMGMGMGMGMGGVGGGAGGGFGSPIGLQGVSGGGDGGTAPAVPASGGSHGNHGWPEGLDRQWRFGD